MLGKKLGFSRQFAATPVLRAKRNINTVFCDVFDVRISILYICLTLNIVSLSNSISSPIYLSLSLVSLSLSLVRMEEEAEEESGVEKWRTEHL